MPADTAIVLFAHGARDPAWAAPLERLAARLAQQCTGAAVCIAYLELQGPDLRTCLEELVATGVRRIDVAPIFWSQGGHIVQDLARIVEEFRGRHATIALRVLPVLAELPGMDDFVVRAILAASSGSPQA